VFEAVGGDNIMPLEPKFTKWFIPYAGTQMVVAYNPKSKYASDFKAYADGSKPLKALFTLLQTPGLKLGRTDPNIDPQGRDFIYMLELAQMHYNLPKDTVSKILGTSDYGTANSSQIYAESALASQYAKATVTIKPPGMPKSTKSGSPQVIDITIIGKPTPAGTAFVKYTLSPAGLAQYKQGGFTLITPTVTGDSSAVPSAVTSELGG
jgi:molybdate/tungstate transport system substrate-binding protein